MSEAAAADVEDLEGGALHVRRSKTDQLGRGAAVYLGRETRERIVDWLNRAGVDTGALFRRVNRWGRVGGRLSPRAVGDIIRRRAADIGIMGARGHSLRVGAAQELVARGAGLAEIQTAGRRSSPTMPGHYGRVQAAGWGAVARLRYGQT